MDGTSGAAALPGILLYGGQTLEFLLEKKDNFCSDKLTKNDKKKSSQKNTQKKTNEQTGKRNLEKSGRTKPKFNNNKKTTLGKVLKIKDLAKVLPMIINKFCF